MRNKQFVGILISHLFTNIFRKLTKLSENWTHSDFLKISNVFYICSTFLLSRWELVTILWFIYFFNIKYGDNSSLTTLSQLQALFPPFLLQPPQSIISLSLSLSRILISGYSFVNMLFGSNNLWLLFVTLIWLCMLGANKVSWVSLKSFIAHDIKCIFYFLFSLQQVGEKIIKLVKWHCNSCEQITSQLWKTLIVRILFIYKVTFISTFEI